MMKNRVTNIHFVGIGGVGMSGIHQASIEVLGPFSEPEIHEIEWREDLFAALVDQLAEINVSTKTESPA